MSNSNIPFLLADLEKVEAYLKGEIKLSPEELRHLHVSIRAVRIHVRRLVDLTSS